MIVNNSLEIIGNVYKTAGLNSVASNKDHEHEASYTEIPWKLLLLRLVLKAMFTYFSPALIPFVTILIHLKVSTACFTTLNDNSDSYSRFRRFLVLSFL